ncbi:hypothetical protein [Taibaiella chishuiensis]|uniref:Uncharacterized protein n=1 Tax=Taibaiella chishuiensis TaxID=1434707 RepID=A0A2P8D113_9BACT|nr:hypothetical protein [Taibaiella chishuiensis]PSK90856.1 hypothetical protein B0I18_107268 [Taibaiella chishuiensis]
MMTKKEMEVVYDTLLCIPGMNDQVKVDLKLSRKNVLLLSQAVERGLGLEEKEGTKYLDLASQEAIGELQVLSALCLEKAGITELNDKLKSLPG